MTWQKLVNHINDLTVEVESKSGKRYPAKTESDRLNDQAYDQLMNEKRDHVDKWAWVEFEEDPIIKDISYGDFPTKPPWEY